MGRQGGQNSPYGGMQPEHYPQASPLMTSVPYHHQGQYQLQPSPNHQPTSSYTVMTSPFLGSQAIPPISMEDEETLLEAREFGKTERLGKASKRERLQILNDANSNNTSFAVDLTAFEPSERRDVLDMASSLREDLVELLAKSRRGERTRTLSFNLATDQQGPAATIGLLLGDKGNARREIYGCVPGSPAHLSGKLKRGDVILQVDSCPVDGTSVINKIRGDDSPGSKVTLTIERDGKRRTMDVGLIRAPIEQVNQKKHMYELISQLCAMAGASPLESEVDDAPTNIGREIQTVLKEIFYQHHENEILLQEKVTSREHVVIEAQVLLQRFLTEGKHSLATAAVKSDAREGSESPVAVNRQGKLRGSQSPEPNSEEKGSRVNLQKSLRIANTEINKLQKMLDQVQQENNERLHKGNMLQAEVEKLKSELETARLECSETEEIPTRRPRKAEQQTVLKASRPVHDTTCHDDIDRRGSIDSDVNTLKKAWAGEDLEATNKLVAAEEKAFALETQIESLLDSGLVSSLESSVHLLKTRCGLTEHALKSKTFQITQLSEALAQADGNVKDLMQRRKGTELALDGKQGEQEQGKGEEELGLRAEVDRLSSELAAMDGLQARFEKLAKLVSLKEAEMNQQQQEHLKIQRARDQEYQEAQERFLKQQQQHTSDKEAASRHLNHIRQQEITLKEQHQHLQRLQEQVKRQEEQAAREREQLKTHSQEAAHWRVRIEKQEGELQDERAQAAQQAKEQATRIQELEGKLRSSYDRVMLAEKQAASARAEASAASQRVVQQQSAAPSPSVTPSSARASSSSSNGKRAGENVAAGEAEMEGLRVEVDESRALIQQLNAELNSLRTSRRTPVLRTPSDATPPIDSTLSPTLQARSAKRAPSALGSRVASGVGGEEDAGRLRDGLARSQEEGEGETKASAEGMRRQRDEVAMEATRREAPAPKPIQTLSSPAPAPALISPSTKRSPALAAVPASPQHFADAEAVAVFPA
eukprot:CAMPEP_0181300970 /NCGR_PEP_ID=MMETSP1101-20121128/7176_1 /TAXON_ID=46948 /ORGANISM="Rhodomonas abbreviata, Strain Caron Lab Isolate" /LENGTH=992 /DNA_ID=CAMNT_0023406247 /DNA_START=104 /DNA_END=3079 /DNA_ORIENTATION=-